MFKIDWDAIRAYLSTLILTVVALYAVWKDAEDYKRRAWNDRGTGFRRLLKRHAVNILYVVTIIAAILGAMEIHGTRHSALKDKADAEAQNAANEKQIEGLKTEVKAGNDLLAQQRQDFLKQFTDMSRRVSNLQTEVKTADLQQEAAQLRNDLETTRKAMEVPKATLSFAFVSGDGEESNLVSLNIEDGVVKVPFTIVNGSDADALEGMVNITACVGCKIVGNPDGFTQLKGQPENERHLDFQHIFARSHLPTVVISIIPPPQTDSFQIGIIYRCRTCVLTTQAPTPPANDLGTALLGPHWRPSLLPQSRVSLQKK